MQQQDANHPSDANELRNEKLEQCVEKVGIMSQLIYKAAYSRPIQYKRHIMNQHKLNEFLGRNLLAEKDGDQASDEFSLSDESQFKRMATATNKRITYSELLQRITAAERHYMTAKNNHVGGGGQHDNISRMMTGNRQTSSASFLP